MSKLVLSQRVTEKYDKPIIASLFRDVENQLNGISEGKGAAHYQARNTTPAGASLAAQIGDVVWNSNPTVITGTITGSLVGNYIIEKWICTVSDPAAPTWKEVRVLTP